jgi:hypothetical protein
VTQKGQTLTQAAFRTGSHITQQLVIALRTLLPAVTDIVRCQTHAGAPATEQAWTLRIITTTFILTIHTVVVTVASRERRQTIVNLSRALKIPFWTRRIFCQISDS